MAQRRHPIINFLNLGESLRKIIVPQSHVGLLYEDGKFIELLEAGKHTFKRRLTRIVRQVTFVDMRERSLTIKGQEILTADKVAIRVSLLVYFRVNEPTSAVHNVASYEERIYEDVQLAARRFLATRNLEAILSDRNEISDAVRDEVKGAAASYGVEIIRADVKDLVFPGNLREIMNQVLETERRAEARLIQARKEAEAEQIRQAAEKEAALHKMQIEKEKVLLTAEAEKERLKLQLESALNEAKALSKNPELLKLKKFETFKEMAKAGAKFIVGLEPNELISQEEGS